MAKRKIKTKHTKCKVCGKKIPYKTKKPKTCKKCKAKKKPKKRKKRKSKRKKGQSKEAYMFKILNSIFPDQMYIENGYYSFLPSPKGSPMQIDKYFPDLKIGFEYDGKQHFSHNSYFMTKKEFKYLQKCDSLKDKLCKEEGVALIRIRYDKEITRDYLLYKIKDAVGTRKYNRLVKKGVIKEDY